MGFTDVKDKSGGRTAITSHKSDMNLEQEGGEGGGKSGTIPGKNSDIGFTPGKTPNPSYTGQGRNLKKEDF